jgi:hypothetical protein
MESVSMRILCVPVILAAAIGAALAIGSGSTLAADCPIKPDRDSGLLWYYRVDTSRKCWFPYATMTGAAEAPAMELQPVHWQRRRAAPAAEAPAMELQPVHWQRRRAAPAVEPPRRLATPAPAAELQRRQADALQRPEPRSEADEAALYLEFLRWKEQHRDAQ